MFKHSAYKYEREVRLICYRCQENEEYVKSTDLYKYSICPKKMITQFMIHPQASKDECDLLKKILKMTGLSEIEFKFSARSELNDLEN